MNVVDFYWVRIEYTKVLKYNQHSCDLHLGSLVTSFTYKVVLP